MTIAIFVKIVRWFFSDILKKIYIIIMVKFYKGLTMTLHVNMSESVSLKVLAFLNSLTEKGEKVEIIDDTLYQFEKKGILKGLQQVEQGEVYTSEQLLSQLQ